MSETDTIPENKEPDTIHENKKNNYFSIAVISILVLIPVIFIIIMLSGKSKPADQQAAVTDSPEQQLINALKTSKTDSSSTSLFNLGFAYQNNKMHKEAIDIYFKVLKIDPGNYRACNNIGFSYGCLSDWDNGIKYCQMAINLYPDFELAKNNLNWMLGEKAKQKK